LHAACGPQQRRDLRARQAGARNAGSHAFRTPIRAHADRRPKGALLREVDESGWHPADGTARTSRRGAWS
jgi:hypothetical protein